MSLPQQSTLTQRVASAITWNTLLFPARFVVGLIASILLFNTLSPAQNGVLALLTGLATTIGLYADLGIERSLPRFIPEIESHAGRSGVARFLAKIITIKLSIVIACITLLLLCSGLLIDYVVTNEQKTLQEHNEAKAALVAQKAPAAAITQQQTAIDKQQEIISQIRKQGELFLWAVSTLVFFGAIYDVFMQFLTAYFKQRAWNIITIIVTLIQPLLIAGFILSGWKLEGVLLGMVITPIIAVALAVWQVIRTSYELRPEAPGFIESGTFVRRFASFAAVSFITQVTNWFYDLAFVLFMLTAMGVRLEAVGLLSFAYKFAKDFLGYIFTPFNGVMIPLLIRIRDRQDLGALQDVYGSLTRIFSLILIPSAIGLSLLIPRLLALLYPQFTTTDVLIYLFIIFIFAESIFSVPQNILMVYEHYRPVLFARLVSIISVPLLIFWIPRYPQYSLIGAAIAVGVARLLPRLATLLYVRTKMRLRFPLYFIGRVAGATAISCIPLLAILSNWPSSVGVQNLASKVVAILSLIVLVGLTAGSYFLALRLLGGLDESERQRILSLRLPFKRILAQLL